MDTDFELIHLGWRYSCGDCDQVWITEDSSNHCPGCAGRKISAFSIDEPEEFTLDLFHNYNKEYKLLVKKKVLSDKLGDLLDECLHAILQGGDVEELRFELNEIDSEMNSINQELEAMGGKSQ